MCESLGTKNHERRQFEPWNLSFRPFNLIGWCGERSWFFQPENVYINLSRVTYSYLISSIMTNFFTHWVFSALVADRRDGSEETLECTMVR